MLEKISVVFFHIVAMLMRFAPVSAFGAMAFTIGEYGVESLANLGKLIATFYLTSLFFVLVVLGAMGSEEHTSELQSLMRISYAVFCLKKKTTQISKHINTTQ